MQITTKKIFTKQEDGTYLGHNAYRLTKSYRDPDGKERKAHVLYLGRLEGLSRQERKELAWMLTEMIENRQSVMSDNAALYEMAMDFYLKYRETKWAQEDDPVLKAEAENELAKIYRLLEVNPNPIGKVKSVVPLKPPQKKSPPEKQGVT